MEIGTIIKNARSDAGISQEQAAEALGVSRQTVSNWETGKTYPDIVSVIKMSDLYSVSLDHLLKEDNQMKDSKDSYQEYLKESTDVVASNERRSKLWLLLAGLIVWALSVFAFLLSRSEADINGYSLAIMSAVLYVTVFAVTFVAGRRNYFGGLKWVLIPVCGALAAMSGGVRTVTMDDMILRSVNWPDLTKLVIGLAVALAGILLGILAAKNAAKQAKLRS